jgi:hypothetical protein
LSEVARSYTHNLCVIFLLILTCPLDIVLVGFLEILYHIPSIICKVMEVYKGEHLSNILVYGIEHITKKGRMCVTKVTFALLGFFRGSKME